MWYLIVSIPDLCTLTYYGVISITYMQQPLGPLLIKLQSDSLNVDSAVQWVLPVCEKKL